MNKILVVDDDIDLLEVLRLLLKKNGFEVTAISQAQKVTETINNANPDILLLDVNLSGYDGREICRHLKTEVNAHLPVILFSANTSYKFTAKDYRADDFIEKPFETKKLLATLHKHLLIKAESAS